jgi:glycosyltransferase involved in cell wall biosynthesis
MIKVAIITRSTLYTVAGGDTVQVQQTVRLLGRHGIDAEIKLTHEAINYDNYHLLHFFNITRPADILCHINKTSKPFVVSTILINYSEYDNNFRKGLPGLVLRHFSADTNEYIKCLSRWLFGKDKMMSTAYILKGQKRSVREIIQKSTLLLPNSRSEYSRLKKSYNCNADYIVVPNGVDTHRFRFDNRITKDPKLVICVARIEGIKNQVNLIKALNNTIYRLVIIGDPAPNQSSYYRECLRIAADNISFIKHVPQQQLVTYYQSAKVHALPSWFETTGLSSLEAGAMGCNIVITDKGDAKEYFGSDAVYCCPSSPESIYTAVERAASHPTNTKLQTKILSQYTWQKASLFTAQGYKKIINRSCH